MANARGKSIDNTHLSIDIAEERILLHRDYCSHVLRWSHVAKYMQRSGFYRKAHVLDIGAGVDLPMPRMLYSNRLIPLNYVAVDYNAPRKFKIDMFEKGKMPLNAYGQVDAAKDLILTGDGYYINGFEQEVHPFPNVITMFEVFEHVEPEHGRRLLGKILELMKQGDNTTAFVSTPCFDERVGAADNHVSEPTYGAFGSLLEDLGFKIQNHWGTFASQKDYKHLMTAEERRLFDNLSTYYDSNLLAIIFAPMYPGASRNCIWELKLQEKDYQRKFIALKDQPGRWTSSEKWEELNG